MARIQPRFTLALALASGGLRPLLVDPAPFHGFFDPMTHHAHGRKDTVGDIPSGIYFGIAIIFFWEYACVHERFSASRNR